MDPAEPPPAVLEAFGAEEPPRLLPGGQGTSWVAGDVVLKPGGGPVHEWLAEALEDIGPVGIRVARPVRTRHGSWSWEGWTATRWVEGGAPDLTTSSGVLGVLEAGRAFHRALAHLTRPACLAAREDWWAVADRVAWGEHSLEVHAPLADVARRLRPALEPLGPSQVVHGDLTGNVLVSPSSAPVVLDVAPYWRPTAYADGVVVADALCWHGADATLVVDADVPVPAVARALLFRAVTTSLAAAGGADVDVADEAQRYERAVVALGL